MSLVNDTWFDDIEVWCDELGLYPQKPHSDEKGFYVMRANHKGMRKPDGSKTFFEKVYLPDYLQPKDND